MMNPASTSRGPETANPSNQQGSAALLLGRPLAKTALGGAAFTGVLFALQHQAEAAVIYSGANQNVTAVAGGQTIQHFQIAGVSGFIKAYAFHNNYTTALRRSSANLNFGHFIGKSTMNGGLVRLGAGFNIAASKVRSSGNALLEFILKTSFYNGTRGLWRAGQTGFAGVQLSNGDLGWIQLALNGTGSNLSVTAIDWAYDSTPGESILAGQTVSSAPEPSRALLLLAGIGSMALRRRRKQAEG